MPRPLLIKSNIHPYHVTSKCEEQFPLPMEEVWPIMIDQLKNIHEKHGVAIHAFVLMNNHFHLLCHTPDSNIDVVMHTFLRQTSVLIGKNRKSGTPLWQGRYKWSVIGSQVYYYQVYRYIYQNPIRASLVDRVEDYPFSTLTGEFPFPLHSFVPLIFGGEEGQAQWLNQVCGEEERKLIRLGLRRGEFGVNRRKEKAFMKFVKEPTSE